MSKQQISFFAAIIFLIANFAIVALVADNHNLTNISWVLYVLGFASTFILQKQIARDFTLIYVGLAIIKIAPISTKLDNASCAYMGIALMASLVIPRLVSKFVYKEPFPILPSNNYKFLSLKTLGLVVFGIIAAAIVLPFYYSNTGAYSNWYITNETEILLKLLFGVILVGIWDELFFINTVYRLLRRHMGYLLACLLQAILFASVLYELGFTSWGYFMIFIFAFIQGSIFERTRSMPLLITLHVLVDVVLFVALVEAAIPGMLL